MSHATQGGKRSTRGSDDDRPSAEPPVQVWYQLIAGGDVNAVMKNADVSSVYVTPGCTIDDLKKAVRANKEVLIPDAYVDVYGGDGTGHWTKKEPEDRIKTGSTLRKDQQEYRFVPRATPLPVAGPTTKTFPGSAPAPDLKASPGTGRHSNNSEVSTDSERTRAQAAQEFTNFLSSDQLSEAWSWLQERQKHMSHVSDPPPCVPQQLTATWAQDKLQAALQAAADGLDRSSVNDGAARVLGLPLGTGAGKTHVLQVAPALLGVDTTVYITYNHGQDLRRDRRNPGSAILLRLLLRLAGVPNISSAFFRQYPSLLLVEDSYLINLAIHAVSVRKTLFVGVDEVRNVASPADDNHNVEVVTATLGRLVHRMMEKAITVTVLVAALTRKTFQTQSGRPIREISCPLPDHEAHVFIRKQLLPNPTEQQRAAARAHQRCRR
jgi:hypothetical protein